MFGQKEEEINAKREETKRQRRVKLEIKKEAHFFLYVYCWIRFPPTLDNIGTLVYIHWRGWWNMLKTKTSVLTRSFPRWVQETPTSLTRTVQSFNAFNNISDSYNAICTNRWEHNKSSITRQEALPKKWVNADYNG